MSSDAATTEVNPLSRHAHWLLRIGFAAVFLFHGLDKLMGAGPAGFAEMMGFSLLVGWLVMLAELAAGILVLIGPFTNDLITRLGGLAAVPVMLGAIFMVHWGQWAFMATDSHPMGGMEFQVVLLLTGLYFLLVGNPNS